MLSHLLDLHSIFGVIDPGQGTAPPGSEKFTTIIKWVAWIVFGLCVVGVLRAAGSMVMSARRGEGGEHAAGLAWVFAGCILAASASGLVGALV